MKVLYLAATGFQLITLINIRMNMEYRRGDIVLFEQSIPDASGVAKRLKEKGIFDEVYIFKKYDTRVKTLIERKNNVWEYIKVVLKKQFGRLEVDDCIFGEKEFVCDKYDECFVFSDDFRWIVNQVYDFCKINFFDEGVGSYLKKELKRYDKVNKIFIYHPNLAEYYNENIEKILQVPLLDTTNIQFKSLLNDIFDYNHNISFGDKTIIVFDQPWAVMPRYLRWLSFLGLKFLVKRDKFQGYQDDEQCIDCFCNIYKKIINSKINCLVKPHPRDSKLLLKKYKKRNIKVYSNNNIPWELMLLNVDISNLCLVSIYSTTVLSPFIYFQKAGNSTRSILLYKYLANVYSTKKINEFQDLGNLFDRAKKIFSNIIIPENEEDLETGMFGRKGL